MEIARKKDLPETYTVRDAAKRAIESNLIANITFSQFKKRDVTMLEHPVLLYCENGIVDRIYIETVVHRWGLHCQRIRIA